MLTVLPANVAAWPPAAPGQTGGTDIAPIEPAWPMPAKTTGGPADAAAPNAPTPAPSPCPKAEPMTGIAPPALDARPVAAPTAPRPIKPRLISGLKIMLSGMIPIVAGYIRLGTPCNNSNAVNAEVPDDAVEDTAGDDSPCRVVAVWDISAEPVDITFCAPVPTVALDAVPTAAAALGIAA